MAAISAILFLVVVQSFFGLNLSPFVVKEDSAFVRFILPNAIYIALFLIAMFGAYVGCRCWRDIDSRDPTARL